MHALINCKHVAPRLALLEVVWFGTVLAPQVWARCKARKPNTCAHTGRRCGCGVLVYRPLVGPQNRSQRILAHCVDGPGQAAPNHSASVAMPSVLQAESVNRSEL